MSQQRIYVRRTVVKRTLPDIDTRTPSGTQLPY